MDGLWIREGRNPVRRPKSKKEVKAALVNGDEIWVEVTALGGVTAVALLDNHEAVVDFVGPDPYTNRKFYGRLVRTTKGWKLS